MKSTIVAPTQSILKTLLTFRVGATKANQIVNTASTNADSVTGTDRTHLQVAYAQMLKALRR